MRLNRTSLIRVATGTLLSSACEMLGEQNRPALHGRFAQQHARHQRITGIMPGEKILLAGEYFCANDPRVGPFDDLIDQQKRRRGAEWRQVFVLGSFRISLFM